MSDNKTPIGEDPTHVERAVTDLQRAVGRLTKALSSTEACGELTSHEITSAKRCLKLASRARRHEDPQVAEKCAASVDKCAADIELRVTCTTSQSTPEAPAKGVQSSVEVSLERQLRGLAEKRAVVSVMGRGCSASEALDQTGVERSLSWARRAYKRYCTRGNRGLLDGRRRNGPKPTVLTPEVVEILRDLYCARPERPVAALHRALSRSLIAMDLTVPSYETVRRWVAVRDM